MLQPTATTKSQGQAALAHLLQTMKVEVQDGPLPKAYKTCGVTSVNHVTDPDEEEISTWHDPELNSKDISVPICWIQNTISSSRLVFITR